MNKIIEMLKEPSTYAGFAALALTLGVTNEEFTAYTTAAATIFGLIAAVLPEKK